METEKAEAVLHIFEDVDYIIKNSVSDSVIEMNLSVPKKDNNEDDFL